MLATRDDGSNGETEARAVAPVLGVLLLLALTVCLAVTFVVTIGTVSPGQSAPKVAFDLSVDADTERLVFEHTAGDELNTTELSLTVVVDGEPLAHQPPVPFFAARGFESGPTGPFNPSGGTGWSAGESASFGLASTNDPDIDVGDEVVVEVAHEGGTIATVETTAR